MINEKDVLTTLEIVRDIRISYKREVLAKNLDSSLYLTRYHLFIVGGLSFAAIALISLSKVLAASNFSIWLELVGLFSFLIAYVLAIGYPFFILWKNKEDITSIFRNPLETVLDNVKIATISDFKYLRRLLELSPQGLSFVLMEMKVERDAFAKRIALVVGSIEKIGLFPGVVAVYAGFESMGNQNSDWAAIIAFTMMIVHIFGIFMHKKLAEMNRIIALVEHVIDQNSSEHSLEE